MDKLRTYRNAALLVNYMDISHSKVSLVLRDPSQNSKDVDKLTALVKTELILPRYFEAELRSIDY